MKTGLTPIAVIVRRLLISIGGWTTSAILPGLF